MTGRFVRFGERACMRCVVVGAGIVGLHAAQALLLKGHEVFILEKENYLAEHVSGRNSGVIHSGIFYETGSFKESACIEGNALTYEWVKKLGVDHRPCGKWVLSEDGQDEALDAFFERIAKLPIPAPRLAGPGDLQREEPALRPARAIFIPSTGILDAAGYVKALARHVESRGATLILNCEISEIGPGFLGTTRGKIDFDGAINAAGLFADEIAARAGVTDYEIRPCRGDYYVLNSQPVSRPVYHLPVPGAHGLGVHLTPTLDGRTLLGPNAYFIENKTDYVHRSPQGDYLRALRHDVPGIQAELMPAYSGNRPKLFFQGTPLSKFTLVKREAWVHVLGTESPGLTAAPVLGREIVKLL